MTTGTLERLYMAPRDTSSNPSPAWDHDSLRDPHGRTDKAQRVQAMFDAIAPTYERINNIATFGRDAVWRRRAVAAANVQATDVILDVACGTGDMIRAFARCQPPPARIVGVDFSREMLSRGNYMGINTPIELLEADALALPLPVSSVDVISCAFGVRNFQDLDAGLTEMRRVARPGARLVILEFAPPDRRLSRWAYEFYCRAVLPWLGWLIARDRVGAYRYLSRSVETFVSRRQLAARLEQVGFQNVTTRCMNLGGVVLYRAERA
ncbi:MAG: ubiquinone/menaquinone biosynthesis methyltransferase [Planctomycetota bacterium]